MKPKFKYFRIYAHCEYRYFFVCGKVAGEMRVMKQNAWFDKNHERWKAYADISDFGDPAINYHVREFFGPTLKGIVHKLKQAVEETALTGGLGGERP